jgi:predicted dehydrogenase
VRLSSSTSQDRIAGLVAGLAARKNNPAMKSVGVLGVGSIADVYIRNAAIMRNFRVLAVAGLDAERTKARAAAWGVLAETPERLIAREDIDVILNLTPPAAHFATTMAALEAGKHVFSEKTLGITFAEACALSDAARGTHVVETADAIIASARTASP